MNAELMYQNFDEAMAVGHFTSKNGSGSEEISAEGNVYSIYTALKWYSMMMQGLQGLPSVHVHVWCTMTLPHLNLLFHFCLQQTTKRLNVKLYCLQLPVINSVSSSC